MASSFIISPRKVTSKAILSPTEGYVRYAKAARLTAGIKQFEEARLGLRDRAQSVIILSSKARHEGGIICDLKEFEQFELMYAQDVQSAALLTSRERREAGIIRDPQELGRVQHLVDPYNSLSVTSEPKPYPPKDLKQERREWNRFARDYYFRVPINMGRALTLIYRGGPLADRPYVAKYTIASEQNALIRFAKGMYNIGRWIIKELVESFRQNYRDFINLFRDK